MVQPTNKDQRKTILEELLKARGGSDGKSNLTKDLKKKIKEFISMGMLEKDFMNKAFGNRSQLTPNQIVSALNNDEIQNQRNTDKVQIIKNQQEEFEEGGSVDSEYKSLALTQEQTGKGKNKRPQSPGRIAEDPIEKQQRRKQRQVFQEETKENLEKQNKAAKMIMEGQDVIEEKMETQLHVTKEIHNLLSEALKTQEGKNFIKLPIVRADQPALSSQVTAGRDVKIDSKTKQDLEKIIAKIEKGQNQNAIFKLNQFKNKLYTMARGKKYYSEDEELYNRPSSGIPSISQSIAQPFANSKSSNSTISVNGSGFAGQKVIPEPREIYNAVTGHVDVTQYKDEKERFAKEVYYKTRNLHPEVRKRAEAVMKQLETIHAHKILGSQKLQKQEEKQIDTLQREFEEHNQIIEKQIVNPHVAAKERKPVVYPVFELSGHEKSRIKRDGEVEMLAIKTQNQAMVSRFQKGLNDNPDAHTQNQMAQRDPGETYNNSIKPDYEDILPELNQIVESLAQQEHSDPEQLRQALAVLDSKDPFEVLFNLNFLNSKIAEVPITTKEQQRIRNESEAIAKKVGRDQVFYPYNKREIELLQGSLSKYTDASGHVVPQPVRSKEYYEGLQQAEQKGVRKEETLKYLRNKQLELENAKGKKKTKLNKEVIELQKQLKQMPDIQEGEPQHGEIGIQQFVEFAHKLIQYVSKIEGGIDPTNTNLANYKTKTTVFTPAIKKKENADFQFTAQSSFKLRPC